MASGGSTPAITYSQLVKTARSEIQAAIERDHPGLLKGFASKTIHFFPETKLSRALAERWLQVSSLSILDCKTLMGITQSPDSKKLVAKACDQQADAISQSSIEVCNPFVCLKIENSGQIPSPVPDKVLVVIALNRLHTDSGIWKGIDLEAGHSAITSGNKTQLFMGKKNGGGMGLLLRLSHVPRDQ